MKRRPASVRPLPGVTGDLPEGGVEIRGIDADEVARFLRAFDGTKGPEARAIAKAVDTWLNGAIAHLEHTSGACAADDRALLQAAADQMFWSRVLFARARAVLEHDEAGDAVALVELASRIAEASRDNIIAAAGRSAPGSIMKPSAVEPEGRRRVAGKTEASAHARDLEPQENDHGRSV